MIEQVYNRYYDTGENYHWVGIYSGDHILRKGEEMSKSIDISSAINQFHVRTVQLVELTDECIEKIVNKIAEVSERKHGEWIDGLDIPKEERERHPYVYLHGDKYCSVCYKEAYYDTDYGQQLFDYCPHCGADMRGEEE